MTDLVTVDLTDGVATVTLASGPGNPLTLDTLQALRKHTIRLLDQPPELLILRAEGPDFCAGLPTTGEALYDSFGKVVEQRDAFRAQEMIQRLRQGIDGWSRLPCPVVAALKGRCHGAGLALALAADFRVAADDTTLAVPEVQWGLISGMGVLARLTVMLGTARALPAVLTHQVWSASDALDLGLVTRLAGADDVDDATQVLVAELMGAPRHARQQALLAMRALDADLLQKARDAETQAAARSWIQGDWRSQLT